MPKDTDRPFVRRHTLRLEGYDYTRPGAYFLTVCTHGRLPLFGEIARTCWTAIPLHFPHAVLDTFVIMPDHVHGIIAVTASAPSQEETCEPTVCLARQSIQKSRGSKPGSSDQTRHCGGSIDTIVASYKSAVTRHVNMLGTSNVRAIWQRNYYEHVIRDEADLALARQYVEQNPLRWQTRQANR